MASWIVGLIGAMEKLCEVAYRPELFQPMRDQSKRMTVTLVFCCAIDILKVLVHWYVPYVEFDDDFRMDKGQFIGLVSLDVLLAND